MAAATLEPGLLPDRYRTPVRVGRGGFGTVFRVWDAELGQHVALKVLHRTDAESWVHLKQEFRTLADVVHPNLVELYALHATDGAAWFTMELVPGRDLVADLRHRAPDGAAPPADRWRDRVAQLAAGVDHLHRARIVHRDLKPANVRVRPDGAVKVLDYGLALLLPAGEGGPGSSRRLHGTLDYLPPEAFAGAPPSPSQDLFGLGVMLYEALTGRSPFPPALYPAIGCKQRGEFPRPSDWVADLPEGASDLVCALLHPDPSRRPEVRDVWESVTGGGREAPRRRAWVSNGDFVGREEELAHLRASWRDVVAGGTRIFLLGGASGAGKTALSERFAAEIRSEARVLRSRCLPSETVNFKALDGAVDDLARAIRSGSTPLAPDEAAARLFPALDPDPARRAPGPGEGADPVEGRRRGVKAIGALLRGLSEAAPLLLWIDDAHWGDGDSARVLRDLLRGGHRLRMLLLCAFRSEEREASPFLSVLDEAGWGGSATPKSERELGPLSDAEAALMARSLIGDGDDTGLASAVAREAAGSPFLVDALCRHVAGGAEPGALPRAAGVLKDRLAALPPRAAPLLALVATAGRPTPREVLVAASGMGPPARALLGTLSKARLVRDVSSGPEGALAPYHDRVREGVLASVGEGDRRGLHLALANAWEASPGADPDVVLDHLVQGGARERAAPLAIRAADRAAEALAFGRAEALYGLAIDLGGAGEPGWALRRRRAEALVNDGRGARAAEIYREAAEEAHRGGVEGSAVLDLRRCAAEHFYRSGRGDEGRGILDEVMGAVGVRLPASPREALWRSAWGRLALLARGLRFRLRDAERVDPRTLQVLDAVWVGCGVLSMTHHDVADAVNLLHLRLALRAGEATRLLRSLAMESNFEAAIGGRFFRWRSRRILATVARLAEGCGDAYERAWVPVADLTNAWFEGRWQRTVEQAERALAIFRGETRGTDYERAVTHSFRLSALAHRGRLRRLREEVPALIGEALERGDLFAATSFLDGDASLAWLAAGEPERLRAELEAARARWPLEEFSIPHYHQAVIAVNLKLYDGDSERAWEELRAAWPHLERRLFLHLELVGLKLRYLRARVALARAAEAGGKDRRRWLGIASREGRRIGRSALPVARPLADLLRAGQAAVEGKRAEVATRLERAAEGFDAADMELHAAGARWALGRWGEGTAVTSAEARARAWLEAEGVTRPEPLLRTVLPPPLVDGGQRPWVGANWA